jgi:hypothetical protein
MPKHFHQFMESGGASAGVVLIPQTLPVGAAVEELILIWLASEASEWTDRLQWLPL